MDKTNPHVVLGLYGTTLDAGVGMRRWQRWRPTVSIFEAGTLPITRIELLYTPGHEEGVQQVAADIRGLSPETEIRLHPLPMANPWDFEEVYGLLHDFARAYPFREDESYLVHITTGTHVAQICLFLLTESRQIPGRLLQTGPPRADRGPDCTVIDLDLARYDRIAARSAAVQLEAQGLLKSGIATRNDSFNRLISRIEQVAGSTRAPILLTGPTGAGKSQLARQIYALKKARRLLTGPLVEVNCATLRGDAAMSALFGHARGAFTGADKPRQGLMMAANGGCLFLDEIGELGLDEQAMLLRAIEDKRFLPLGADREVESDFQLIAGTNRALGERVAEGRFREDLLARIDLWTFRLPGLAERPEDVEPNLDFELDQWHRASGQQVRFNREARTRFVRFATSAEAKWSANFRDLNAAVVRMATLATGGRIDVETVDEEIERLRALWRAGEAPSRVRALFGPVELDRFDRVQLEDVLEVCATSPTLSEAGRRLFAVSRAQRTSTNDADRLRKYLGRFGLTWEDVRAAPHRR
jgi:transcriptional regulatory protein RtcR